MSFVCKEIFESFDLDKGFFAELALREVGDAEFCG